MLKYIEDLKNIRYKEYIKNINYFKFKRIDRYITVNYIKSIFISMFAFINIFIISQLFKIIRYVTEGRMTKGEAVLYTIALLPDIIIKVSPLSVLLGGLMTTNKMATNLEIIALKTSGISFKRIIMFPLVVAFMFSLVMVHFNDEIYPRAIAKSRYLKRHQDPKDIKLPPAKLKAFLRGQGNYIYRAKKIKSTDGSVQYMQIIELNKKFNKITKIINAKSGKYDYKKNVWVLNDVSIIDPDKDSYEIQDISTNAHETMEMVDGGNSDTTNGANATSTAADSTTTYGDDGNGTYIKRYVNKRYKEEPELFFTPSVDVKVLNIDELKDSLTVIKQIGGSSRKILIEIANRQAFPFASFVVSFIGLALGSRYVRGGNALNIIMCVGMGYGYYIVQASLEAFSSNGILHPIVAMWIPNLIFLGIGIYTMNKAEY